MDDIHLEDPRKFSAKQIKEEIEHAQNRRSVWQYLFDLIVKTLICATLIAIDFVLFANAGSYNIFASGLQLNYEAQYIFVAIFVISFIIMLIASFWPKLENMLVSACFAGLIIALINQFATFEKHSGLLILFSGIFSDNVNAILYEYSFWIIGLVSFVVFLIVFTTVKRSFQLYFLCILLAVFAWIVSEAYFNTSLQYFRTVASSPTLRSENLGKHFVFLAFNSLTSPNNINHMAKTTKQNTEIKKTFDNLLGFLDHNNFILYPNAMVENPDDPFLNLVSLYNPVTENDVSEQIMASATRDTYFDFYAIQKDKMYIKNSAIYKALQKDNYKINVYQTRNIDVCYLDSKLAVASCREKINMPVALNDTIFSRWDRTLLLISQWLNSTGYINSFNPVLKLAEYVLPLQYIKPFGFEVDKIYALNAFKVFDLIAENIDKQTGNQAYFAIIDLPSETYVYNEFCQLNKMADWKSEKNIPFVRDPLETRRNAYAEQTNCLIGSLEKFVRTLKKTGQFDNTTIVITGLNNPQALFNKEDNYYRELQAESQVLFAIKPENSASSEVNYDACTVSDIMASYFITKKPCKEFVNIKTTEKNMKQITSVIEKDKIKQQQIDRANSGFEEWIKAWAAYNQIIMDIEPASEEKSAETNDKISDQDELVVVDEVVVTETVIEDVPEQKMETITKAADEANMMEQAKDELDIDDANSLDQKETDQKKEKADDFIVADDLSYTKDEIVDYSEPKGNEIIEEKAEVVDVKLSEDSVSSAKQDVSDNDKENVDKNINNKSSKDENKPENNVKTDNVKQNIGSKVDALGNVLDTAEDVIPETLFDTEQEKKSTENAIAKAKRALENKKAQKNKLKETKTPAEELDNLVKDIETLAKNEDFREVLEAPVAKGQNLSPEELKKQYHQNLKEAAKKFESNIDIKVNLLEK